METLYKVIYNGQLKPGTDLDRFARAFSEQFGTSEAQALQLANAGKEVLIKKNISTKEKAFKYLKALAQMGMDVRLETMEGELIAGTDPSATPHFRMQQPESEPVAAPPPRSKGRTCPKCGSSNLDGDECLACGIFISRYRPTAASDEDRNPYATPEAELYEAGEEGELHEPVALPAANGWQWIARGFWHFRQNPGPWIGAFIVFIVLSVVLQLAPIIGPLIYMLLSPVFTAGFMLGCHEQEQGGDFRVSHLFEGFSNNAMQLVLVGVLYFAATLAIAIIIGGGMFMLFLGGMEGMQSEADLESLGFTVILMVLVMALFFIPLVMAYWFAPALVTINGLSAFAAMRTSFQGCLKNILPFLLYGVILMLLGIVAIIPMLLGLLIFVPVLFASMYVSYRDIFYGPTDFGR